MSIMSPVDVEGAFAVDYASETAVGLLDALIDTMSLARPGTDAKRFAKVLRRLADGSGFVAQELEALLVAVPAAPLTGSARFAVN